MDNKSLFLKVLSLKNIKDENLLRINLYGYCSQIILSRSIFKNNKELIEFISILGLEFRDYVYASRTVVVSRIIRDIEKRDISQLSLFRSNMIEFLSTKFEIPVEPEDMTTKRKNTSEDNYVKSIVDKYRRGK